MRTGGAERVIGNIIRNIDRGRFLSSLGLIRKGGQFLENLPENIEIFELGVKRVRYSFLKLISLIRENRPDVIFSILGHLNFALMLVRPFIPRGIKLICRETNIPSWNTKESPYPGLYRISYRILYPRFDRVVCQSSDMLYDLVLNFSMPLEKTVVINNPVDVAGIEKLANVKGREGARANFNLLAAGKLKHQKGFDLLLKSVSYLKNVEFHLTILGKGPDEKKLKRLAQDLGISKKVTFGGSVNNPYNYMKYADLFLLSSRFEGFGNVVLESMSCGTPVIAFDCPGGTGEIIKNGINGFKVRIGDTVEFAAYIKRGLQVQWDSKIIKELIRKKYDINQIIPEYERLFMDVISS